MATTQRYPIDHSRWRRPLWASAAAMALVLVIVLTPDAQHVQAANLFAALRTPGEAAFVAGHRGAQDDAPENTLPAFQRALESDAQFVETDLQVTADGVPVIMHDFTVDRTTNGTGPVWALTSRQIARLDAGSWFSAAFAGTRVPTLDQFLGLVESSTKGAILELKGAWTASRLASVVAEIRAHQMGNRVIISSFDIESLKAVATLAPDVPRVVITHQLVGDPAVLAATCGAVAIVTSDAYVTSDPGAVARIHAAGLGVLVYTLNSAKKWSKAIALGVDGILTDKPNALDEWIAKTVPGGGESAPALETPSQ